MTLCRVLFREDQMFVCFKCFYGIHLVGPHTHVMEVRGTTCRSQFSPFNRQVPGIELRASDLVAHAFTCRAHLFVSFCLFIDVACRVAQESCFLFLGAGIPSVCHHTWLRGRSNATHKCLRAKAGAAASSHVVPSTDSPERQHFFKIQIVSKQFLNPY